MKPQRRIAGERLPAFPAAAIRAKVTELGFGSGPWRREELYARWGTSAANKFIADAKGCGWLVSPYRGVFFVPAARDLMLVSWLPRAQREEFIISRTLAATGLPFWSLSGWARRAGLEFSRPLFVTDLGNPDSSRGASRPDENASVARMRGFVKGKGRRIKGLPYLEDLIIVPQLGQRGGDIVIQASLWQGKPTKNLRNDIGEWPLFSKEPTRVEYVVSSDIIDGAWIVAFLTALNLPRLSEKLVDIAKAQAKRSIDRAESPGSTIEDYLRETRNWSAYFGPPMPNEGWHSVLAAGVFPYLLVPATIWDETLSAATSRTFREIDALGGELGA